MPPWAARGIRYFPRTRRENPQPPSSPITPSGRSWLSRDVELLDAIASSARPSHCRHHEQGGIAGPSTRPPIHSSPANGRRTRSRPTSSFDHCRTNRQRALLTAAAAHSAYPKSDAAGRHHAAASQPKGPRERRDRSQAYSSRLGWHSITEAPLCCCSFAEEHVAAHDTRRARRRAFDVEEHARVRECPRICVGMNESDAHAFNQRKEVLRVSD